MRRPDGVGEVRSDARGFTADLGGPILAVTAVTPWVVRVRFAARGSWRPRRSWAVTRPVETFPAPALSRVDPSDREASIAVGALEVTLHGDGRLAIRRHGRELAVDPADGGVRWKPDARRASWTHLMPPDRAYFGFGERTGLLDKRGRRYTCWTTDEWRHQGPTTDALYLAIPFFLALDPDGTSFGVWLDSTFRSAFDLTRVLDGTLTMEVEDGELDWYLVDGPEPVQVVERFTELVGRAPLPPRWALGYHQARWSYRSADEVRAIAENLREHRIPADAVHLDIDHTFRYRPFTWDPERFPDPAALIADLRRMGLRTTVVVDAGVVRDREQPVYRAGHERGYFVRTSDGPNGSELTGELWGGPSVYPDHTRDDVRRWWGGLYRGYLDVGVAGFLNDMNEPAMHDLPFDDPRSQNAEPPADTPFGDPGERATHAEVRNVYALLENAATAQGLAAARPDERTFLLTRAGFAGIQRHAAVWTGDNASHWEHLEMSLAQLVNLGLSGVPLAGADIGGFFADCPAELLVRWMQLGAVYPFARNNSAEGTTRQEPWVWGEPTTGRCRRAMELRYRLLPYLYTIVREACETGRPVLRPLFLEQPADPIAQRVGDQALLGAALLVAPVVRPGVEWRDVRLPAGAWCDFRTGAWHEGGRTVLVPAGLDDELPLLVRAGSIVPVGPAMQSTDERPLDPLTLHVFPADDGSASGSLYEDDGVSMGWRDGVWRLTRFEARAGASANRVWMSDAKGRFVPPPRRVEAVVHERDGRATRSTVGDGTP